MNKLQLQTPLHMCVRYKEYEILKLLVPFKPAPNLKDKEGNTPLHVGTQTELDGLSILHVAHQYLKLKRPRSTRRKRSCACCSNWEVIPRLRTLRCPLLPLASAVP